MSLSKKKFVFKPFKVKQVKYRGSACPRPRSGHRICCDDVNIYCFGGYNPSLPLISVENDPPTWSPEKPLFRELWSFSMATLKWELHKTVQNMPEELASNAMCINGKYLMIFGGTGAPFGDKCINDVIIWHTGMKDGEMKILEMSGNKPPGQYGQSIFCHDNYMYSVGGTSGFAYNCDIYRLNLRTLTWESVFIGSGQEEEPLGRYRHEVARVGEKLYIIGGGTGEWAFELMEVPVFDLQTRTWSVEFPKPDDSSTTTIVPSSRKCHSSVQINTGSGNQLFVVGGSDGQSVFKDVWRLDLSDMQWTIMRKTVLPRPLYFHSSAVTSYGCMYIFGGIEPRNDGVCRNNVMYKVWICIPKLSEICWEALLYYYPDLDKADRKSLLKFGIPVRFVDRVHPCSSR